MDLILSTAKIPLFNQGSIVLSQNHLIRTPVFFHADPGYLDRVDVGHEGMYPTQFSGGRLGIFVAQPQNLVLASSPTMVFAAGTLGIEAGGLPSVGSLTKWSFAPLGALDPAEFLVEAVSANNSGNVGAGFTRHHAVFTPPKTARFIGLGGKFNSMPATGTWISQYVKKAQVERKAIGSATPGTYGNAREIRTFVKADRVNLFTNPSGEVSTASWSGTPTLSTVRAVSGTQSFLTDGSANQTVEGMKASTTYTASAWVYIPSSVTGTVAPRVSSTALSALINGGSITVRDEWVRVWMTFTTDSDGGQLAFHPALGGVGNRWIDALLLEEGDVLGDFFDGSFGGDHIWESGGTAGVSRSYYYKNRLERYKTIKRILAENAPLGIGVAEPQFGVLNGA